MEHVDLSKYLNQSIKQVIVGGESGDDARVCNYDWVLQIRQQCMTANVPFVFKQTGAKFYKDGKLYAIPRKLQHFQAKKAKIDFEK